MSSSSAASRDAGAPPDFECAWRSLAYRFSQSLQPWRPAAAFRDIFDALELASLGCNVSFSLPEVSEVSRARSEAELPHATTALYVDPNAGNDANPGTEAAPLQHVAVAVRLARGLASPATVVLRAGVHRLAETLELNAADSGLTIAAFPGESPVVSGGAPIAPTWRPFNVSGNASFVVLNGTNNMYAQWPDEKVPPTIFNRSATVSPQACEALCVADSACKSFIWHDPATYAPPYASICFHRTDSVWSPVDEVGIWSGFKESDAPNVWVADGAAAGVPDAWRSGDVSYVPSLFYSADGGESPRRATRARFPNADPELAIFPEGWSLAGQYQPGVLDMNSTITTVPLPQNYPGPGGNFSPTMFTNWYSGLGASCSRFTPPASVWCQPLGRTGGATYFIRSPAGFVYSSTALPHSPYASDIVASGARFNWFRQAHWYTQSAVISGNTATNSTLTFGYGAFHGCEGAEVGEGWFIEQVLEELDAPNEFIFDAASDRLFYFHNATQGTPPPPAWTWEVPLLPTLVRISGTASAPAADITLSGLTFTAAASSLMMPHDTPSGGDWAVARVGAVQLEGSVNVSISSCLFSRVDGNAVVLSGFNRNASIDRTEFVFIGETAILSVGNADGADATAGDQPWGTRVTGCLCHEIGHFQKQASCYFQALTSGSLISDSIFFNGPRAMVSDAVEAQRLPTPLTLPPFSLFPSPSSDKFQRRNAWTCRLVRRDAHTDLEFVPGVSRSRPHEQVCISAQLLQVRRPSVISLTVHYHHHSSLDSFSAGID